MTKMEKLCQFQKEESLKKKQGSISVKFPAEGRGNFAVAMTKDLSALKDMKNW